MAGELRIASVSDVRNLHELISRFYCAFRNLAKHKLPEASTLHTQAEIVLDALALRYIRPDPMDFMREACASLVVSHGRPGIDDTSWHELAFDEAYHLLSDLHLQWLKGSDSDNAQHSIDVSDPAVEEIVASRRTAFERSRTRRITKMLILEEAAAVDLCRREMSFTPPTGTALPADLLATSQLTKLAKISRKAFYHARGSDNAPAPTIPGSGQQENYYSWALIRSWMLETWPKRAARFPVSYSDVKLILAADD